MTNVARGFMIPFYFCIGENLYSKRLITNPKENIRNEGFKQKSIYGITIQNFGKIGKSKSWFFEKQKIVSNFRLIQSSSCVNE